MSDSQIKQRVQQQFGAAAEHYVTSASHASGPDLRRMVELAQPQGHERLLDIATGGGHTALAFAPVVREVIASDLTPEMLAAAEAFVRGRGATNVRFELADAEALPFDTASFDIVTVRTAPHHFPNPGRFAGEAARVLRPGGTLVFNDQVAPEDDELDAFINRVEQWRDPSHVRALRASEWRDLFSNAGMTVEHSEASHYKQHDYAEWTSRINLPAAERDALEAWMLQAPPHVAQHFNLIVEDRRLVSFRAFFAIIVARRAA